MTINTSTNKTIVFGNGSQTQFAFGFIGVAAAYISVILTDSSGTETVLSPGSGATQYQISLNPAVQGALWGVGGTVTYDPSGTPVPNGSSLTIFRTLPLTQAISLQSQISLQTLGNGAETGLDTLEMQLQQVAEEIGRVITAPISDPPNIDLVLPPAAQRANTFLGFDAFGNVIAGITPATGIISTAMQPVVAAASLAAGRTAFGLGSAAVENIGAGLSDDGHGNLEVLFQLQKVATNQAVTVANHTDVYLGSGSLVFTLDAASTLFSGFSVTIYALSGQITLQPNAADAFFGQPSGAPITIAAGSNITIFSDGASSGIWYFSGSQSPILSARNFGVTGNGTTDDSIAINTFLQTCSALGAIAYFPGGFTYNCGSSQILVPAGLSVIAAPTATLVRTADPGTNGALWTNFYGNAGKGAMVFMASNAHWTGGILNNTAILGTSTTSVASATGSKTFTVASGLNIAVGNFLRIQSASAGAVHMEGTVTSYSGTSLVVNVAFAAAGTKADWNIFSTGVWQAPIACDNCNRATIDDVTIQGNWYVGFILSGWNASVATLITQNCKVRRCTALGVFNRGFYQYGTCAENTFDTCYVDGLLGITDYGFNNNPANATGTLNTIQHTSIVNPHVVNTGFQGIAVADLTFFTTITSPDVNAVISASGIGILIQTANNGGANQPQYTMITNPMVRNAASVGIFCSGTSYANITGGAAITCGIGFEVAAGGSNNSAECTWANMLVQGCTTGVNIAASQANTLLTGRATANGTNLVDGGTGTVHGGLITT